MPEKEELSRAEREVEEIERSIASNRIIRKDKLSHGATKPVKPKPAASVILVDGPTNDLRILMGKRNRSLKFMPGALVFPGGRIDRHDHIVAGGCPFSEADSRRMGKAIPASAPATRVKALAAGAIRELAEETGIVAGKPTSSPPAHRDWEAFNRAGCRPAIDLLRPVARAVTPPYLPRRFDTWFFTMRCDDHVQIPESGPVSSGELEELRWIKPEEALAGDTREITRVILVEFLNRLRIDPDLKQDLPFPSYVTFRGRMRRTLL